MGPRLAPAGAGPSGHPALADLARSSSLWEVSVSHPQTQAQMQEISILFNYFLPQRESLSHEGHCLRACAFRWARL